MSTLPTFPRAFERTILIGIAILFVGLSISGITWGLPSRQIDGFLFGNDDPWSGEKIARLVKVDEKFSPTTGADVDVNPLVGRVPPAKGALVDKPPVAPVNLTATDQDIAAIYLRYRLYTHQPDEMITMMALAGMKPGNFQFDPRLYQYGGLFIYPVGALIKLCGLTGLIEVRRDLTYYLDNPDEFGKFYIVARAYSAAWGVAGVFVVFAIAKRLGGAIAAISAALLYSLLPVVVCMAHEGKPHLPGAVLMLMAALFSMRYCYGRAATDIDRPPVEPTRFRAGDWWAMCICCGAAVGMVLSSIPILTLIPTAAWIKRRKMRASGLGSRSISRTIAGLGLAVLVYSLSNPYVLFNLFVNRDVLRSNFGNSLAMYEFARWGEGFVRVLQLTGEGATFPVMILGVIALVGALWLRNEQLPPLAIMAGVFVLQFVLIGAEKPAEYGRFGVFTNSVLAIGTSCLFIRRHASQPFKIRYLVPYVLITTWVALFGFQYLKNFRADAGENNSRMQLGAVITQWSTMNAAGQPKRSIALLREPAPYCCPPMNFANTAMILYPSKEAFMRSQEAAHSLLIEAIDKINVQGIAPGQIEFAEAPYFTDVRQGSRRRWRRETAISWANKPFIAYTQDWLRRVNENGLP